MNGRVGNRVGTSWSLGPFGVRLSIAYYASILNSVVAGRACSETVKPADLSEIAPQKSLLPADLANKHKCHGNLCCWVRQDNSECRPLPANSDQVVVVGPAQPKLVGAMPRPSPEDVKSQREADRPLQIRGAVHTKPLNMYTKRPKKANISHCG